MGSQRVRHSWATNSLHFFNTQTLCEAMFIRHGWSQFMHLTTPQVHEWKTYTLISRNMYFYGNKDKTPFDFLLHSRDPCTWGPFLVRTWFSGQQKWNLRVFACSGNLSSKYVFFYALDDSYFLNLHSWIHAWSVWTSGFAGHGSLWVINPRKLWENKCLLF